mgnify:CR=1 FL=1
MNAGPGDSGELDALLSAPGDGVVRALKSCPGDIVVLGAGGKMGPTLARMAARACVLADGARGRRVMAVSRFSSPGAEAALNAAGIETVQCDLLDRDAVARLPDAPNVVFMAGQKFGTADAPERTWALNVEVPGFCADRYASSRIVAFSTGNVYPLVPTGSSGSRETDPPQPLGDYAKSCLAREQVFESAAASGTRVAIVRLNYAIALTYGVLTDLATRIAAGTPIPLAMGQVNVIWQGDANRAALELLAHAAAPARIVNVTGADTLSVRLLAKQLGTRLGRTPIFEGTEAEDALLSDASLMHRLLAPPLVSVHTMLDWTAAWVANGGPLLGKPTKYDVRDGRF